MALSESHCHRLGDTYGKEIKTFSDETENHVQSLVPTDDDGNQIAIFSVQTETLPATEEQEELPTSSGKNNPSYSLTYDGDGNLVQVDQAISGTTYRKTNTYVADDIATASEWVEV